MRMVLALDQCSEAAGKVRAGGPALLRPAALAALPRELLRGLKDAVITLDTEQIKSFIEDVGGQGEVLGGALRHLGNRYAYAAILSAIKRAEAEDVPLTAGTIGTSGTA